GDPARNLGAGLDHRHPPAHAGPFGPVAARLSADRQLGGEIGGRMAKDMTVRTERKRGEGVQFVYRVLRDDILNLALPPGSPIDENQLAERLSMSRTPIREALVRLAGEGLVTTLPNRSTVVSNIDFLDLPSYFDALTLMYRVTTRLAAENRTPQ